jgi:hypothetical protein
MRTALLWVIKRRVVAISYTQTISPILQCQVVQKLLIRNYNYSLRNETEEVSLQIRVYSIQYTVYNIHTYFHNCIL